MWVDGREINIHVSSKLCVFKRLNVGQGYSNIKQSRSSVLKGDNHAVHVITNTKYTTSARSLLLKDKRKIVIEPPLYKGVSTLLLKACVCELHLAFVFV